MRLSDMGERAVVSELLKKFGIGDVDDCAYISVGGKILAITSDTVGVETHMVPGASYADFGWYACAVSMSDLASAGAKPVAIVSNFTLPPEFDLGDTLSIAEGVNDCARHFGCRVVGGDTKEGKSANVGITAIGIVDGRPMKRSDARVGDVVAITGEIGRAYSAILKIREGVWGKDEVYDVMRPMPRIYEGIKLAELAHACIDMSDGVYISAHYIADASGVGIEIYRDDIPLCDRIMKMCEKGRASIDDALAYGGDFELMITIPEDMVRDAMAVLDTLTVIGRVVDKNLGKVLIVDGEKRPLPLAGYEHFKHGDKGGCKR
ncbi:MAG: thiamine-phosphate kinase [Thermoplasmata archaeon]|nr:MAG: thiamine-phosphate kinase [Thermoplasmata archaeon]